MNIYSIFLLALCMCSRAGNIDSTEKTIELFFMQELSSGNKIHEYFYSEPTNTYNIMGSNNLKECNESEYTTCYEYSTNDKCHWEINTYTKALLTKIKISWWKGTITCSNLNASPICPYPLLFSVGLDNSIKFTIPNTHNKSSTIIPSNTFCYWEIYNPKLLPIKIQLKRFSVFGLM